MMLDKMISFAKVKSIFYSIALFALFMNSCSPKIATSFQKSYKPLGNSEEVIILTNTAQLPNQAEALGTIKIGDTGFTTNCDSSRVINLAKDKARGVGGNVILLTEVKRPSLMGSSCYRMAGDVYRINSSDLSVASMASSSEAVYNPKTPISKLTIQKQLPRFTIFADGGYGWRIGKIDDQLSADMHKIQKNLNSGFVWNVGGNYYFNDTFGIGALYYDYSASTDSYGTMEINGGSSYTGNLNVKNRISFYGPTFAVRGLFGEKFLLNTSLSLGYIHFYSKMTISDYELKTTGGDFGGQLRVSGEYLVTKNWGIGLSVNSCTGSLSSVTQEYLGRKEKVKFGGDNREGLNNISVSLGVRYYIR